MENENYTYIRVRNEADRNTVASILFSNGYKVTPHRKKNGKAYEYYVGFADQVKEKPNES